MDILTVNVAEELHREHIVEADNFCAPRSTTRRLAHFFGRG